MDKYLRQVYRMLFFLRKMFHRTAVKMLGVKKRETTKPFINIQKCSINNEINNGC